MEENDFANKRHQLHDDFVSNVTLHGYRYMFVSEKKRRFVWLIFFSGAIVFAIWLFVGAVSDYFQYESYTNVKTNYDVDRLEFPTLTICYHQPYTTLNKHDIPIKADDKFYQTMLQDILSTKKDYLSSEAQNILGQLEASGIDTYEKLVHLMVIDINDTLTGDIIKAFHLKGCTFNSKKCSYEDFRMILDVSHSPCLQYNYLNYRNEAKKQFFADKEFWFKTYFNLHDDKALGVDMKGKGITLYIHERNRPHVRQFDVEITLQPGILTTITLKEFKTTKLLPPPHGECGTSSYRIIKDYPYSFPMCRKDCYLDAWYNKCGCLGFSDKDFLGDDKEICSTEKMVKCQKAIDFEAVGNTKACMKGCLQECVQNKYPLRLETFSLLSAKHTLLMKRYTGWNMTDEDVNDYIKKNIVGLKIGFSNLVHRTETTTPSVTITTLLGTIGGSIGLGLGFSVLTLVEFLFFFMDYMFLYAAKQPVRPDGGV